MRRGAWGCGGACLLLLAAVACSGGDEGGVPVAAELTLEAGRLDLGEAWVGQTLSGRIGLQNRGVAPARLGAITVEGAGFELPGPLPARVPASSRVEVEVRFRAAVAGEIAGRLRVDGPDGLLEAGLTATGKPVPDCDDENPCTEDTFDLERGRCIRHDVEGTCEDGSACTTNGRCHRGECVGEAVSCDDGDPCTRDLCESDTGCVARPDPDACDDANPCTADACDPSAGCTHTPVEDGTVCAAGQAQCERYHACDGGRCEVVYVPDDTPCDDGSACTDPDVCTGGACGGAPVDCDDGEACTAEACDPVRGCVVQDVPDGTPCGEEGQCFYSACAAGACRSGPRPDGTPCDDDHPCTEGDSCAGGRCQGTRLDCGDEEPCTVDWCDDGVCSHEPAADGVLCAEGGAEPSFCVLGACTPRSGIPDGSGCFDGDPCTVDAWQDGQCVGTWVQRPGAVWDWEPAWTGASGLVPLGPDRFLALDPDGATLLVRAAGRIEPIAHTWYDVGRLTEVVALGTGRFAALRPPPDTTLVLFDYREATGLTRLSELPLAAGTRHAHLAATPEAAYVASVTGGFGGWSSELRVVDLAAPTAPRLVSTEAFDGDLDVAVAGGGARLLTLHGDGRLVAHSLEAPLAPTEAASVVVSDDAGDRVFLEAGGRWAAAVVRETASDHGAIYDAATLGPFGRAGLELQALTDLSFVTDEVVAVGGYPPTRSPDPICEAPLGGVEHVLLHVDGTLMARWTRPDPIGLEGAGGLLREGGRGGGRWSPVGAILLTVDPETLDVQPLEAVGLGPLGRIALGVWEGWTVGPGGVTRLGLGVPPDGVDLSFRESSDRPARAPALARVAGWTPGPWIGLAPILAEAIPACTVPVPLSLDWWDVPWGPLATTDVPGVRHLEHERVAGAAAGRFLHTAHVDYGALVLAVWQPPVAPGAPPTLLGHVRLPGCEDAEVIAVDWDDLATLTAATCAGHTERILLDTSDPAAPVVARREVVPGRPLDAAFAWRRSRLATLIEQPGTDAAVLRIEAFDASVQPSLLGETVVDRARAIVAFDGLQVTVAAEAAAPRPGAAGELVTVDLHAGGLRTSRLDVPQPAASGLSRWERILVAGPTGTGVVTPACGPPPP